MELARVIPGDDRHVHPIVYVLGAYALGGGLITLAGWFMRLPRLTDWFGLNISMFANTAVAVSLAGAGVIVAGQGKRGYVLVRVLGGLVALIGGATLMQHITGLNLGIDTLLINPEWGTRGATSPGRMGLPASTSFVLLGIGLILLTAGPRARRFAPLLGISTFTVSLPAMLGYLLQVELLYSVPRITGVAVQTATMLLALALAIIWAAPDCEPVRTLREDSAAGLLARRTLPVIVTLPILLGWIWMSGDRAGYGQNGMGAALLLVSLIALLCSLLWSSAAAVRRHETMLRDHSNEIEALNAQLQRAMAETHHRVKNNLQVISALIDLQAMEHSASVPVAELKRIGFHVQSLATIHDLLTEQAKRTADADLIRIQEVMDRLAPLLRPLLGERKISFEVENLVLPSRQGTSLAVLVNELVGNSVKHGAGEVRVTLRVEDDQTVLRVSDNGPGFAKSFDPMRSANTGLLLVDSISRLDLHGAATYKNDPAGGASVSVVFPRVGPARVNRSATEPKGPQNPSGPASASQGVKESEGATVQALES